MNTEILETERLILRPLQLTDAPGMYLLDSDAEVHTYLGEKPIKFIDDSYAQIKFIQTQYQENGIGRWAVIEKQSNTFIGWSGLKLITENVNGHANYYDLGYRFIKNYWGKGYASESAEAWLKYAFNKLAINALYAIADVNNQASIKVLKKLGLEQIEQFNFENAPHYWFKLNKTAYAKLKNTPF